MDHSPWFSRAALAVMPWLTLSAPALADSIRAETGLFWKSDMAMNPPLFGNWSTTGSWYLGTNTLKESGITYATSGPTITGSYSGGGGMVTISATSPDGIASGTATSIMAVFGGTCPSYTLFLDAKATSTSITHSASAQAVGGDPLFLIGPGYVGQILSLGAGSLMTGDGPAATTGHAHYVYTAFGLSGPLATVDIANNSGSLSALVTFNPDPRLTFVDPMTLMPITPAMVEAAILGSALGSSAGLASDLPLFEYEYDLTSTPIPPGGAFFASDTFGDATAAAVPEPATWALAALGFLGLALYGVHHRHALTRRAAACS